MKKREFSRKRVAVAIAVCVLAAVLWLILFGLLERIPEEVKDYDTKHYEMEATFAYLGSEENLPLENVYIGFPAPHVNNEKGPWTRVGRWYLYKQNENGALRLQVSSFPAGRMTVHGLISPRTSPPRIEWGTERTDLRVALSYELDVLYPREVLRVVSVVEDVDVGLTIRYEDVRWEGENRSLGAFAKLCPGRGQDMPFDFPIDFSFWAQLSRVTIRIDGGYVYIDPEVLETYSRTRRLNWGNILLYPADQ